MTLIGLGREPARVPRREPSPQQDGDEPRIFPEIAVHEAARLAREAVKPLQPCALHPARSALDRSGDEIERGSDAQCNGRSQEIAVRIDPELLLRRSKGDEYEIGTGGGDPTDQRWTVEESDLPILDSSDGDSLRGKSGRGFHRRSR